MPRSSSASTVATRPRARRAPWPPGSASARTASSRRSSVLSGGERRRVELARILFAGSDVLCLDEPTNHLDVDAKTWLMGFLRQYRGALLVISHDLDLLDEAITRVLHLDRPGEDAVGHDRRVPRHLHPVRHGTGRGRASVSPSRRPSRSARSRGCRSSSTGSVPRPLRPPRQHSIEKRIARLEADKVDAPQVRRRSSTFDSPTRRRAARP